MNRVGASNHLVPKLVTSVQLIVLLVGGAVVFLLTPYLNRLDHEILYEMDGENKGFVSLVTAIHIKFAILYSLQFASMVTLTFPYRKSYIWRLVVVTLTLIIGFNVLNSMPGV